MKKREREAMEYERRAVRLADRGELVTPNKSRKKRLNPRFVSNDGRQRDGRDRVCLDCKAFFRSTSPVVLRCPTHQGLWRMRRGGAL